MKKSIYVISIILMSAVLSAANENGDKLNTKLPTIEIETNVGLLWLLQLSGNLNLNDNV